MQISGSLDIAQDRVTGVSAGTYTCPTITVDATGRITSIVNGTCSGGGSSGGLRPFPSNYIYVNPGLAAPPNQMIEFLVSPTGSDAPSTNPLKGLTNSTDPTAGPFATIQCALDYIQGNFYTSGTQPVIRLMAGTYQGSVQVTNQMAGAQPAGGGQIAVWGTGPITNSPNNSIVGYVNGPSDVLVQAPPSKALYSVINGGYVLVGCQTVSSDVYPFDSQQHSNIFVTKAPNWGPGYNGVIVVPGPTQIPSTVCMAENGGQIYITQLAIKTSSSSYQFEAINSGSQISFFGGVGEVSFAPGVSAGGATFYSGWNAGINIENANQFAGSVNAPNKAIVTEGGYLNANGTCASLPGNGVCFSNTGGNTY